MRQVDHEYIILLERILGFGEDRPDRTGTGTRQIPYHSFQLFNVAEDFPAISFKKLAFKTMLTELNWFLLGRNDIEFLHHHKCHIWDGDYKRYTREYIEQNGRHPEGFGFSYGPMWNLQEGFRQWAEDIKNDPFSRRHVVYNGSAVNRNNPLRTALQPCHDLFIFLVHNGKLSISFHMRSVDVGLGLPFNIASYALLLHAMARATGYQVGSLYATLNNVHIYQNHIEELKERLALYNRLFESPNVTQTALDKPVGLRFEMGDVGSEYFQNKSNMDFVLNASLVDYNHLGELKLPLST